MFNDIEPIPDASTSLQYVTKVKAASYESNIVKYKDNYYKHKYKYEYDGNEYKYILIGVSKISIDTNTFGVQDIGDGDSVLVTPNGENGIVHGHQPFSATYYLDNEGNLDLDRPFTSGYYDGSNYYDDSGAIVSAENVESGGAVR